MITPKQGMSPFQLEQARKQVTYERMTAKTPMVGPVQKAKAKVVALTQMIPVKKIKQELKNVANMIIPIVPDWLLQLDDEEKEHYMVSQVDVDYIVEQEDIQDWSYLFKRFDSLMGNLMKLLNNIRKINYAKIIDNKLFESTIVNRHISIKESLLEKQRSKEDEEKDTRTYRKANRGNGLIEDLINIGAAVLAQGTLGMVAGLNEFFSALYGGFGGGSVDPLDAATIDDAKSSGADLVAAAHLATLEASGEQNVADVMQVILNRSAAGPSVAEVITAHEQFSPYSAAIYGTSQDTDAAAKYGLVAIQPAEIFELAKKSNGLELLTQRFGAGNPQVAQKVLDDFKSQGKLSKESANFVGGATFFMGYPTGVSGERHRGGRGANYFRDNYARGAIVVPELLKQHKVEYNSKNIYDDIGKFVVDRPTVISMAKIKEPLIVIPLERPIGQEILKSLFEKPFQKVEDIIKTSGLSVHENQENILKMIEDEISDGVESEEKELEEFSKFVKVLEADAEVFRKVEESHVDNFIPILSTPPELQESKKTDIDTISDTTEDPFSQVILFTQDIIVDN